MSTTNDAMLSALREAGYTGSLQDCLGQWLTAMGYPVPGEYTVTGAWWSYLSGLGYLGAFTDSKYAWYRDLAGFDGAHADLEHYCWTEGLTLGPPEFRITAGALSPITDGDPAGTAVCQLAVFNETGAVTFSQVSETVAGLQTSTAGAVTLDATAVWETNPSATYKATDDTGDTVNTVTVTVTVQVAVPPITGMTFNPTVGIDVVNGTVPKELTNVTVIGGVAPYTYGTINSDGGYDFVSNTLRRTVPWQSIGSKYVEVSVEDADGQTYEDLFNTQVSAPVVAYFTQTATLKEGVAYTNEPVGELSGSDGSLPYTFSIDGAANGYAVNSSTGIVDYTGTAVITAIPTATGKVVSANGSEDTVSMVYLSEVGVPDNLLSAALQGYNSTNYADMSSGAVTTLSGNTDFYGGNQQTDVACANAASSGRYNRADLQLYTPPAAQRYIFSFIWKDNNPAGAPICGGTRIDISGNSTWNSPSGSFAIRIVPGGAMSEMFNGSWWTNLEMRSRDLESITGDPNHAGWWLGEARADDAGNNLVNFLISIGLLGSGGGSTNSNDPAVGNGYLMYADVGAPTTAGIGLKIETAALGADVWSTRDWPGEVPPPVPEDGVDPRDPPYNAVGNGTTDDSAAIQSALDAEDQVSLPAGVTFAIGTGLTVTKILDGTGTLLTHPSTTSMDWMVKMTGSGSRVAGITIDCNSSNVTPAGRGEGIRAENAQNGVWSGIKVRNSKRHSVANSFFWVSGDNGLIEDCESYDGGYAAMRIGNTTGLTVTNWYARDFQNKGITVNGYMYDFTLDGADSVTTTEGREHFQIDFPAGGFDNVLLKNCSFSGFNDSNFIKIQDTPGGSVTIEDSICTSASPNLTYSMIAWWPAQDSGASLTLTRVTLLGKPTGAGIMIGKKSGYIDLDTVTIDSAYGAGTQPNNWPIRQSGGIQLRLRDVDIKAASHGLATSWVADDGTGQKIWVDWDGGSFESDSSSGHHLYSNGNQDWTRMYLRNITVINTPSAEGPQGFTGSTASTTEVGTSKSFPDWPA